MNKFRVAALEVLEESKTPLHYQKITRLALEKGLLETDGATPDKSMGAQIYMDIRTKGKSSDFKKVSEGTFEINKNKIEKPLTAKIVEGDINAEEEIKIEGSYTGSGGEHVVCSELLFRGFNASIMSVDIGMDIIATKDSKLYSVQVKTANINKFQEYNFDIRKVSLERNHSGNIYYVFVLRGDKETNYLILPNHEVERQIHDNGIHYVGNGKKYRVRLFIKDGHIFIGNLSHEMDYYLNNWALIK